jgi:hypothetical protein
MSDPNATIEISTKRRIAPMGNIEDEFYDEYYATICPSCHENSVDEYEEKCTHCLLVEFENLYSEDLAPELSVYFD